MLKVINAISFKGGVSKSSGVFLLSKMMSTNSHKKIKRYDYLREAKKVLMVDLDLTPNLSRVVLGERYEEVVAEKSVINSIKKGDASDQIEQIDEGLFLLPGTLEHTLFSDIYKNEIKDLFEKPWEALSIALAKAQEKYNFDYIIIDNCPNAIDLSIQSLNVNLGVENEAVVFTTIDATTKFALNDLFSAVSRVQTEMNPNLVLKKVVPTLINPISKKSKETIDNLREAIGGILSNTAINNSETLKNMFEYGFSENKAKERKALEVYYDLVNELNMKGDE